MRSTCTAPTARTTPSASGSKTPSAQTPASHHHHSARKRAVIRTVGPTPDPVRYLYVNRSPVPRTAHGHRARPARNTAHRHPPPVVFPQVRRHLSRYPRRPGGAWIRPTHSPRSRADGFCNLPFCPHKTGTPSCVTGSDLGFYVAVVGSQPTEAE